MTVEEFKALPMDTPILIHWQYCEYKGYYVVSKQKQNETPDYCTGKYSLTEANGEQYAQFPIKYIDDWCSMEELDKFFKTRALSRTVAKEVNAEELEIEDER